MSFGRRLEDAHPVRNVKVFEKKTSWVAAQEPVDWSGLNEWHACCLCHGAWIFKCLHVASNVYPALYMSAIVTCSFQSKKIYGKDIKVATKKKKKLYRGKEFGRGRNITVT